MPDEKPISEVPAEFLDEAELVGEVEPVKEPDWTAVLDGDGVLIAYDTTGKMEGVPVPAYCDLTLGKYRWDGQTFVLAPKEIPAESLPPPDAMRAIAMFVDAVANAREVPRYSSDWARWYLASLDGMGG